jgi:hypothetical protein
MATNPPPAKLDENQLEFAWKTHAYIHEYIRFSDTKASFVVTWCLAIVGGLCYLGLHELAVESPLKDILRVSASAFFCALWSIIPQLATTQLSGLIFWESIKVHAHPTGYQNELGRHDIDMQARHLCEQTHMVANIASVKYWWVWWATSLTMIGTACAVAALVLKLVYLPAAS